MATTPTASSADVHPPAPQILLVLGCEQDPEVAALARICGRELLRTDSWSAVEEALLHRAPAALVLTAAAIDAACLDRLAQMPPLEVPVLVIGLDPAAEWPALLHDSLRIHACGGSLRKRADWELLWRQAQDHWRLARHNLAVSAERDAWSRERDSMQRRFRSLADAAPVLLWKGEIDGSRTWFNRKWLLFTDAPLDVLLGFGWLDLVHPDDVDVVQGLWPALERTPQSFRIEYRLRDGQGRYRWVLDSADVVEEDGLVVGFAGSCIDIHDHKRLQAELVRRENILRTTVANAGVGLAQVDAGDLTVLHHNPQLARMFRATSDRLIGQPLHALCHPEDHQRLDKGLKEVRQTRRRLTLIEVRCLSQRGRQLWVDLSLAPVSDQDGTVCHVVAVFHGITLHRERAERLASRNEELTSFANASSHDLQAPLRTVSCHLDLLRLHLGDQLDEDAEELLGKASGGIERMRDLILGIRNYLMTEERLEEPEPLDLDDALDHGLANLEGHEALRRVRVERDGLPRVRGDATLLAQCFQNLIGNALKHAPQEDGLISIHAERDEEHGEWQIRVDDNGNGVPPASREAIFRLFYSRDQGGSGVGLAFVRRIVEAHGGEIWVEDSPQGGARFVFTLPCDRDDSSRRHYRRRPRERSRSGG